MKPILDVCCGSKMFYFDKNDPRVHFNDIRECEETLCDGRKLIIQPDTKYDFRNLPFKDNTFSLVVFDPPHLIKVGDNAWLAKKYGKLPREWQPYIKQGFDECMRVLKENGVLIFKWNETDISTKEIIECVGIKPIFGQRTRGVKTHWYVYMKETKDSRDET